MRYYGPVWWAWLEFIPPLTGTNSKVACSEGIISERNTERKINGL